MTAVALPDRFNDDEYKNWLKTTHSLLCLRNGIENFIKRETKSFHLLLQHKLQGEICQAKCIPHLHKFPNPCPSCKKWMKEILNNSSLSQIHWKNTNPPLWHKEEWEVAKVYMPKGQTKHKNVSDFDIAALLNFMKNCKHFHGLIKGNVDKVIQVRNVLMHSALLKVKSADMESHIDTVLDFINQLLASPHLGKDPDLNKALEDVKELQNTNLQISLQGVFELGNKYMYDLEMQCLKEKIGELRCQMEDDSDRTVKKKWLQEVQKFKEFMNNNKDVSERLSTQLELLNHVAEKVKEHDEKLERLSDAVNVHEDDISILDKRVQVLEDTTEVSGFSSPGEMHKNRLFELAHTSGWSNPKFSEKYGKKGGYIGVVEVNTIKYEGRKEHKTKVSSHQEVARIALTSLGHSLEDVDISIIEDDGMPAVTEGPKHLASVNVNLNKTIETDETYKSEKEAVQMAYFELARRLQLQGQNSDDSDFQSAVEHFFSEMGWNLSLRTHVKKDDKKQKCHLTIVGECTFQSKDGGRKLKDAEQEAAKTALQNLAGIFEWSSESINPSNSNFKGKLQELLIKSGHGVPTYTAIKSDLSAKETSPHAKHVTSAVKEQDSENERKCDQSAISSAAPQETENMASQLVDEQSAGSSNAESPGGAVLIQAENLDLCVTVSCTVNEQQDYRKQQFAESDILSAPDETTDVDIHVPDEKSMQEFNCENIKGVTPVQDRCRDNSAGVSCTVNEQQDYRKQQFAESDILSAPDEITDVDSHVPDEKSMQEFNCENIKGVTPVQDRCRDNNAGAIPFFSEVTVELKRTVETQEVYQSREMAMLAVYNKLRSAFQLQTSDSDYSNSKEEVLKFFNTSHYNPPEESYEETDNKFKCKLALSGKFHFQNKEGASRKKAAEHEAAKNALTHLASIFDWDFQPACAITENYKGKLQELLMQSNHRTPTYKYITNKQSGKEATSPPTVKASASPDKAALQTDTKAITTKEEGSKIQHAFHKVDDAAFADHATKTISEASASPDKAVLQTDSKAITTAEEGSKIQHAFHKVDDAVFVDHATKTVSEAMQHVLEKFPPKFICAYASEVTVHLKNFKTETSAEYRVKQDAKRAAYKSLGKALGILDETADAVTATSKVNEFLSQNGYKLPEEIISGNPNKFVCQLTVTCSFSCRGKGSSFVQAQEEAAKQAVLQLTCILGGSSNSMTVSTEGCKQLLSDLLQEHGQDVPVYRDEYKCTATISFTNFVIESQKKWNNKKLAHTEVALRLLGLLGLSLQEEKRAKNCAQEWFQERRLPSPKYTEDGNGSEGFVGKVAFSACVEYCLSEPQLTEELAKEKLMLKVQQHLEFIADKDIQLNQKSAASHPNHICHNKIN